MYLWSFFFTSERLSLTVVLPPSFTGKWDMGVTGMDELRASPFLNLRIFFSTEELPSLLLGPDSFSVMLKCFLRVSACVWVLRPPWFFCRIFWSLGET